MAKKQKEMKHGPVSDQQGFTLIELVIALLIFMIATLGIAVLFAYATNYNSGAYDRTLAHAVAQKQMEYLSRSSFDSITSQPQSFITSGGRTYAITTTVCTSASCGGGTAVKKITVDVTPQGAGPGWVRSSVHLESLRTARGTGPNY
jgi:type II secretion system protein I